MAGKAPSSIEIRSYRVGFGDCFLLSFVYGEKDRRNVLIDFGTFGLWPKTRKGEPPPPKPPKGTITQPKVHMPSVAKEIRDVCSQGSTDPHLTAVVATHRHADHISGFSTETNTGESGKMIAALKPRLVMQPWTEDPKAAKDATSATPSGRSPKSFVAGLASMGAIAETVSRTGRVSAARRLSASVVRQIGFLGMDNIANESAVNNLREMGRAKGASAEFLRYRDKTALETLLPGVKVHVLGPPDLTQTKNIKKMAKTNADQFWGLMAATPSVGLAAARGTSRARSGPPLPPEARWFRGRLDRLRGQSLLQIVRSLDNQMNNTSLILLFEVGKKKLLFPGDAQLENWAWALQQSPEVAENRRLLREVDVYKVGHHGSLNATPRVWLWDNFRKRGTTPERRMQTLLSSLKGIHGHGSSRTEVPRTTLVKALEKETDLNSTLTYKKDKVIKQDLVRMITVKV